MILGGRHVGIPVSDMASALHFYHELLGFSVKVNEREEGSYIETVTDLPGARIHIVKLVARDGWMVELLEYESHPGRPRPVTHVRDTGCAHIALTVDDLDSEYVRLSDAGVSFNSPPQRSPNGYAKVAFCRDADGNFVELVQVLDTAKFPSVSSER
jgi:catechol 2,3-dioxygenase-like lactoylglutathione lyase family enzyme